MTRKTVVLLLWLVILLGAGLMAYGVFSGGRLSACRAESEADKLAELEADLIEAAGSGNARQANWDAPKQTPSPRRSRTRST
jgi:hypothetical protein